LSQHHEHRLHADRPVGNQIVTWQDIDEKIAALPASYHGRERGLTAQQEAPPVWWGAS
jgi:hypothetical protein